MTEALPRQPWETDAAYQDRLAAWDASKEKTHRANGGSTTETPNKENELSVSASIAQDTDISAEGQLEWLRQTGVAYRTLDDKGVATYVTVAAEGLRIKTEEGNQEIVFPLALNAREEQYKSHVCLQRDDSEQPWDVCTWTADEGVMTPAEARDFGAQLAQAASLAERLNGLAAL